MNRVVTVHTSAFEVLSGRAPFADRDGEIKRIGTAIHSLAVILVEASNVFVQFILQSLHQFRHLVGDIRG